MLVARYQKRAFNIVFRMLGDYEDAADVVQEAFLSAFRSIKKFRGDARFSTWLYSICVNQARNRMTQARSRSRHEGPSLDEPVGISDGLSIVEPAGDDPPADEQVRTRDLRAALQECIGRLEREQREVLVLRDIHEFSYEEISDILNIPDGTVKSRLSGRATPCGPRLRTGRRLMSLCNDIKPLLSAYADGELSAGDAKLVADHAAACAACRAELAAYRKTHALLAGLDEVEPPAWLADKIMAHVRDEAGKEPGLLRRIFYPLHVKIPIPAIATVFVVCLIFYLQKGAAPPYETTPVLPPGHAVYEKAKQSPKAAKMRAPVPDSAASEKSLPAAPPAPSFAPAPQSASAPAALPPPGRPRRWQRGVLSLPLQESAVRLRAEVEAEEGRTGRSRPRRQPGKPRLPRLTLRCTRTI